MSNYILVIDIGTQSCRASIVNDEGEIVAFKSNKYQNPYLSPKNGYVEQDPNFYYDSFASCTMYLKENNGDLLGKCKSIVVTAFRDSPCFLDENYNIVRNSILWLDQRSAKLIKSTKWYEKLMFTIVGMKKTVIYNKKRTPAIWLQENEPQNWSKIKYYVPLTAYWNYRMTGKLVDSEANIIGHYPINFKKGKWYGENHYRTHVFQIPISKLCPLVETGNVIGTISKQCSIETGIPEGINLIASGTDKTCEVLGNGCLTNKEASISYGTACCIDVPSKKYHAPEPFLPGYKAPIKDLYDLEVQVYRGYWMLKWFIKEFVSKKDFDVSNEISLESILDNKILNIEPGCNGLVLQPYWGPSLKRPLAKGAIVGFTDVHTKYHVYRAIIEGICFALREGLDSIRKQTKKKLDYLVVSGGGSQSDIIAQITADIFNIPVRKTKNYESCTIGAAISGFISEGVFKNEKEAVNKMVSYQKEFTPNPCAVEKYHYLYKKIYKKIYPKLNKCYGNLKEFTNNEIL